jgi:hypothetical protein
MSIDFERRLRSEMEHAPISPRPNVVREAYRRSRRRRHATRGALTAATAMAAGVAATVALIPGGPAQPNQRNTETTAYLVSRLTSALTGSNNEVLVIRDIMVRNPYEFPGTSWSYGDQNRTLVEDYSGRPVNDTGDATTRLPGGTIKDVRVLVDYQARTVTSSTTLTPASTPVVQGPGHVPVNVFTPANCPTDPEGPALLTPLTSSPSQMAASMRKLLTCSRLDITWHQRIAGTEVIKIVINFPKNNEDEVLYVDESTFLPVEMTDRSLDVNGKWGGDTFLYSWLPPTKANLALLNPPIPPGFRVIVRPPLVIRPPWVIQPPKASNSPEAVPSPGAVPSTKTGTR